MVVLFHKMIYVIIKLFSVLSPRLLQMRLGVFIKREMILLLWIIFKGSTNRS